MKPAQLEIPQMQCPVVKRQLQAAKDNRTQWIQACQILNDVGGQEIEKARDIWREHLLKLTEDHSEAWANEVNRKATEHRNQQQAYEAGLNQR